MAAVNLKLRMKSRGYNKEEISNAVFIVEEIKRRNVGNYDKFCSYLFSKICKKGAFRDTLTEGMVALIFAYNGFDVTYLGHQQGPDLLVEGFGYRFYVEVRHYREDTITERKLFQYLDKGQSVNYGRGAEGTQKDYQIFCRDILEKAKQLPEGEIGMVFVWSEDEKIGKDDFRTCRNQILNDPPNPKEKLTVEEKKQFKKVSGVLFYTRERKPLQQHNFHFFVNPLAQNSIPPDLEKRLRNLPKLKQIFQDSEKYYNSN